VRTGFGVVTQQGEFAALSTHLRDKPHLQMNDSVVDAHGRFWAGSMTFDATLPGSGALYRLDPDGTVSTQLNGVTISNGIGWSPDSKSFYYVDSATRRIDVFDYDLDAGTLGKRRTLAEVKALPDGLAVDVDGCVWVAMWEGWEVVRFTPSGRVDRIVRLPGSLVTTCTFGGEDLRTLFISVSSYGLDEEASREQTAGHIFAMDPGVQGLPTHEFLG
jgi:sugar lactone lactonase YvrE